MKRGAGRSSRRTGGDVADTSGHMDSFNASFASRPLVPSQGMARFVDPYSGWHG
jgi:hypothetical protein